MTISQTSSAHTPALHVGPGAPADEKARLQQASEAFEAIFVRQMLAAASKADFGGDDLFGSAGQDTFREMRDAQFAEIAARSGSLGIAESIAAQLSQHLDKEQ